jgi:hypothetical protein
MKSHSAAQAGLELIDSSDPAAPASQEAGVTSVNYHTQLRDFFFFFFFLFGSSGI